MPAPTPLRLFLSLGVVTLLLFVRPPWTNFVFDEQEAILANPYLLGEMPFWRVFYVDFWGLPPERTIGSYRPLPNLLWRSLSFSLKFHTPWALGFINLFLHAGTATLLARTVPWLLWEECENKTPRLQTSRLHALTWFAGLSFTVCAFSTEAVSGVVGLADVLVGFFSAICLWLLARTRAEETSSFSTWAGRMLLLFLCFILGLLSKESMLGTLCAVPLVFIFLFSENQKQSAVIWGAFSLVIVSALSLVSYVTLRNYFFLPEVKNILAPHWMPQYMASVFLWFAPLRLPDDPMNNPLVLLEGANRLTLGLATFFEQFFQVIFPWNLAGDYSFPRQSAKNMIPWGLLGGGVLIFLVVAVLVVFVRQKLSHKPSLSARCFALGSLWFLALYLPVSNLLVLLPTVRADRLFYAPTLGIVLMAVGIGARGGISQMKVRVALFFLSFHSVQARAHAFHYSDDVAFWRSASSGSPASAKSYLNLGVMVGARGDLDKRLQYTRFASELVPAWPMGQIYLGDTYCRRGEMPQAMSHYLRGFALAPQSKSLTSLALQCIWEKGAFDSNKRKLQDLAGEHPDTWLDYFVYELTENGKANRGIPAKYRPRKYNARRRGQ